MAIESRLRSRPRRICASREQVGSDQGEMATKSPQGMVRESALLQAEGGARWADTNANEHATNGAGGKQARRARWAGEDKQTLGGKGRLSSTAVSCGGNWGGGLAVFPRLLLLLRRCRKGTLAARPYWALGGALGETEH
ncbi:hypothetical protein TrVGV298_006071 [Trichoderma virens]|nr:hypothetical protein TrVGV298_006071 [Trichoderma virens]